MTLKAIRIALDFKQKMQALYGNRLERIVLVGSYVHDEFRDDSDIDFIVVPKDKSISR